MSNTVYVVTRSNPQSPGGFCFRNMGPDKITVEPGVKNAFPEEWVNAETLKQYIKEGHMKRTGDAVEAPEASDVPKVDKEAEAKFEAAETAEMLKELCVFENADVKDLKRAELDEIIVGVYEQVGIPAPEFDNKDQIIAFLTGESK